MALTPEQRSLRASIAAHSMHAVHDSHVTTANGRAAFLAQFLRQVDEQAPGLPEDERLRRAEHLLRAYMGKLALRSSRKRQRDVMVEVEVDDREGSSP